MSLGGLHRVEEFFIAALCEKDIGDQTIIAGVSGGVDSMTMLALFKKFQKKTIVVHINYHLRGKDSDEDENFVRAFCNSNSIPVVIFHFDKNIHCQKGLSLQMVARAFRYEKFMETKVLYNADYIALGHHWDDFIETLILHMTRGAGLRGLIQDDDEKTFFRPLSKVTKHDIIDFALHNSIRWREDQSNSSATYERNRIRNEILPLLKTLHPRVSAGLMHTVENLRSAMDFIRFHAKEYVFQNKQELYGGLKISLQQLHPWRSEYKALLEQILYECKIPVLSIEKLILSFHLSETKVWNTGYPLVFTRNAELYVYHTEHRNSKFQITLEWRDISQPCEISGWGVVEKCTIHPDIRLISEILHSKLELRPWLSSDFIYLKDGGRKSVASILKDKKLNIVQRNKVLVMTSDSEIVWVVGIQADARYISQKGIGFKARCFWL